MEIHEDFTKWAKARGVKINGISAHRFEGRGLGIRADRDLEVRGAIVVLLLYYCCAIVVLLLCYCCAIVVLLLYYSVESKGPENPYFDGFPATSMFKMIVLSFSVCYPANFVP
jgi:hypothetical protein